MGHTQAHAFCCLASECGLPFPWHITKPWAPPLAVIFICVLWLMGGYINTMRCAVVSKAFDSWPVRFVATSTGQTWWPPALSRALPRCCHTPAALAANCLPMNLLAAQQHAGTTPGARTPEEQRRRHDGTCIPGVAQRAWLLRVGLPLCSKVGNEGFSHRCLQPACACTAGSRTCSTAYLLIGFGFTPQVAHFVGLACATLLVFLLYGKIGVE